MLGLEGDRHWPNIAAALELDHLRDDPRFATMEGRRDHAAEVTATLQERFGSSSRAEWGRRLDAAGVWWAKVQHAHELIDDEQAHAAGGFVDVPVSDGTVARMVATPVDFSGHSRFTDASDARTGPGHRARAARARLGVGAHRGAQASRRHHLTRQARPPSRADRRRRRLSYPAPPVMWRITAANSSRGEKSTYSVSSIADGEWPGGQ